MTIKSSAIALALAALTAPAALMSAAPAYAQAASESDAKAAAKFIDTLSSEAFAVIRSGSANSPQTRAALNEMLAENFDVNYIGQYLIRRHKKDIDADQYRAYMAVFPTWVVATYTNNLFAFEDSEIRVIRAIPRGARGDVEVFTRIIPKSGSPFDAVWQLRMKGPDDFKIRNLKVSGVNMALTQEQDFNAYIGRNGFDALVALMKKRIS
ncbi:ABC transporter substrate-binding protein [Pacificimonas sp. WHA3]|uniref:ABC transporter substrate-binding protein n=1 Tax=Pacificimonas pallii TaxID=2827236 RepID=A0ABS6SDM7_9SPHN|nr:ABC transporter substrate-binding protein [Pacificimonas pallii]MBV7256520.1 ABC transporter substrate-binding protein [Pacificimonas pallii]